METQTQITGFVWGHPGDKWQSAVLVPELANSKTSAVISLIPTVTTLFSLAIFVLLDGPQICDTSAVELFYLWWWTLQNPHGSIWTSLCLGQQLGRQPRFSFAFAEKRVNGGYAVSDSHALLSHHSESFYLEPLYVCFLPHRLSGLKRSLLLLGSYFLINPSRDYWRL